MLTRYIVRLRNAPQHVRERHAFLVASGVTAVVAILWLVMLPVTLEKAPVQAEGEEAPRPLSSFITRAREQMAALIGSMPKKDDTVASTTATSSEPAATTTPAITLSPEDLAAARAKEAIEYAAPPTTTARVVRIATTTPSTSTTTSTSTR